MGQYFQAVDILLEIKSPKKFFRLCYMDGLVSKGL